MSNEARLTGCGTALVTPFTRDGRVDETALESFVDWQVKEGIHFVVPCGSTGEAATLSIDEQQRVIEITVNVVAKRVPVVAGAGSNDTQRAIALTRIAKAAGATHALHASPMYNKPPQRGIEAHFRAIASAVDLPIIVYNVPGRTASNIEARTALNLAQVPGIVGIKEASGNIGQIGDILRDRPAHFSVLSGDDSLTLPIMALGGDGVISVTSNATPAVMSQLTALCAKHEFILARGLHNDLLPWMSAAFVESNPIPVKAALAIMGRMEPTVRLPLVPLDPKHMDLIKTALFTAGVTLS